MNRMVRIGRNFLRLVRVVVILSGIALICGCLLNLTSCPWRVYSWLATDEYVFPGEPDYIVVLGGGGIPSESGLMRTYYGASAATHFFKTAKVIVALPEEPGQEPSSLALMKRELEMRGVSRNRILAEGEGHNTREQALLAARMLGGDFDRYRLLLVTSPEHMKRSLLAFRKAGFKQVMGWPAMDVSVEVEMTYEDDELGGHWSLAPDVGDALMIRYTFWNHLNYTLKSTREIVALAYYWVRGWV